MFFMFTRGGQVGNIQNYELDLSCRRQPSVFSQFSRHSLGILLTTWVFVLSAVRVHGAVLGELSERQIMDLVIERTPNLQSLRLRVREADERLAQARAARFPTIDFNAAVNRQKTPQVATIPTLTPERTASTTTLDLRQPIYLGGSISRTIELAEVRYRIAEQDLIAATQTALSDALQSAYQLAALQEERRILLESQKLSERYEQLTRQRFKHGGVRDFELTQAEAELTSFESRVQQLESSQRQAREVLATALQVDVEDIHVEDIVVRLNAPRSTNLKGFDETLKQALADRPDVKSAILSKQSAQTSKWLDLSQDLPQLVVNGQWGWVAPSQRADLWTAQTEVYTAGIALRIPIFSGLSSLNKYRAGEHAINAAEKTLETLQLQVRTELIREWEAVQTAQKILRSGEKWVAQAERALKQAMENYRIGSISSFQVVQLQGAKERAALAYNKMKTDFYGGLVRLYRAQGRDLKTAFEMEK